MSTPSTTTGYVLAGGLSRRMGRDKALLDWSGRPLLAHMADLLSNVCKDVRIVGREELPDSQPGLGPIGGISAALNSSTTSENLIIAVDLPLLTEDFLKYFKERFHTSRQSLVACKVESHFPLCLGIRKALSPAIDQYIVAGGRSLQGFIAIAECEIIAGQPPALFMNINTPADYAAALEAYKTINRDKH